MPTTADDDALRVDGDRLRRDLESLARIGARPEGGIDRGAFGESELAARAWFRERLCAASLAVCEDPAGNLGGRLGPEDRPSVMCGSHLDTVPGGGALDGAYGVVAGLECLRRIKEAELQLPRALEVVAFSDEEGRFGGMLGSLAMAGGLDAAEVERRVAPDGTRLVDALRAVGLDPAAVPEARRAEGSIASFVELHIEQGPVLTSAGDTIGVVTSIAGLFRWALTFRGEANHAGTTPMVLRKDALAAAALLSTMLPGHLEEIGQGHSVATIGQLEVTPGAANVVPGEARLTLDVRDPSPEVLGQLATRLRQAAAQAAEATGTELEIEVLSEISPVPCAEAIQGAVREQAERLGLSYRAMHSGAAHDAQQVAAVAPMGMIFVPSEGGRSHCSEEHTPWADLEAGANVLLQALLRLARG